jgi:hypothetical protein
MVPYLKKKRKFFGKFPYSTALIPLKKTWLTEDINEFLRAAYNHPS